MDYFYDVFMNILISESYSCVKSKGMDKKWWENIKNIIEDERKPHGFWLTWGRVNV